MDIGISKKMPIFAITITIMIMTRVLRKKGAYTDDGLRSIRNFEKRARLWLTKTEEARKTYWEVIRHYAEMHGPIRLCDTTSYSEPIPAHVRTYDDDGAHDLLFDTMIVKDGKLRYRLIETDGIHGIKWLSEVDIPWHIQEILAKFIEYPRS